MRHSRWLRLAAVLFALLSVLVAHPAAACASDEIRVDLGFGAGSRTLRSPAAEIRQYRLALQPTVVLTDVVRIGPTLAMSRADVSLDGEAGLPFSATLDIPWTPTLGFTLAADLVRCPWFRLELSAEYEQQVGASASRITRLTPDGALADALLLAETLMAAAGRPVPGLFEAGLLGGFGTRHRWDTMQAALTMGVRYRFVEPTLGLGVLTFRQNTTIDVLPVIQQVLDEYDVSLRTRFATDTTVPLIAPGVRVDLWGDAQIRLRAVWLSSGEFSFTTFDGALFVPLDL